MIRLVPALGPLGGCVSGAVDDPTPHPIDGTTDSPPIEYQITWEPDGDSPSTAGLPAEYAVALPVAGDCATSFVVSVDSPSSGRDFALELFFDRPPTPGLVAPVLDEFPVGTLLSWPWSFDAEWFYGGLVEVIDFGQARWAFRLGGEGFVQCDVDACVPSSGGLVSIEPLTSGSLPSPLNRCFAGESYVWPDGWEACVLEGPVDEWGECPETLPW